MELFSGIDWSQNNHEICVINTEGNAIASFQVEHTSPEKTDSGLRPGDRSGF
jgi:hypothetical protein